MKKATFDPITGKTDYHTSNIANKNSKLAQMSSLKEKVINDGRTEMYALPLYENLTVNPLRVRETTLKTKENLSLVLVSDGSASQDIPVKLAA